MKAFGRLVPVLAIGSALGLAGVFQNCVVTSASIAPVGPSADRHPVVSGTTATANAPVAIYFDSPCDTTPHVADNADENKAFSIEVSVPAGRTTAIYTHVFGNDQECVFVGEYTHIGEPPTLSSNYSQVFSVNQAPTAIAGLRVVESATGGNINHESDIAIRIPAGFDMEWDTSDTNAVIGGSASSKVSPSVAYENPRVVVIDVTTDFAAGDSLSISGLAFRNFTAASAPDNLELLVDGDDETADVDNKTVTIAQPSLSSSANQGLVVDPNNAVALQPMTITEDPSYATINSADDLRISIPYGIGLVWNTADTMVVLGGTAANKVSTNLSYEDSGRTAVLGVTTSFVPGDGLIVNGLSAYAVEATAPFQLGLDTANDGGISAQDDKAIQINGS